MKSLKYIFTISIITLLLSSCSVGKKYSRTELNIPEQYREDNISVTADTLLLPWETFFKDTILKSLIKQALEKNNDVEIAILTAKQLDLTYKQAKLAFLPNVDFSIGANRNWFSKSSLNGSLGEQLLGTNYMDDYSATLKMNWEIDIWGKTKMQKEGALADYFGQKENLSAIKTRIIVQVAQAYYGIITLDEQIKIAERNILLADSTLYIMNLQFNAGMVNSLAVEQAAAQKKTAELLIPLAKQNIAIQENALSILCGNYPKAIERTNSFNAAVIEKVFPTGVPAELLGRRPDVKMAEYNVKSANSRTGLAKAAMFPSLSISPSVGANSFIFKDWFSFPSSIATNLGVNLLQPIFQRRSLKTAYEKAILEQEKAVFQFKQTVMTAVSEVSDALSTIKYTNERLGLVEQKTTFLNKSTNDAILLYTNGMASYLEVITAQNNALQNELEAINIKKDELFAIIELYRALGGGVE